ncbi:hypothetical protein FSP39_021023 [Pinctada imbricata]|uniref:TRPM2 n=1 Tax=Pinctada imbricata TaxID=66713 RepID=A0AA88Y0G6_PINIB|nr:hypothetical protein FSP39_021023 [Pinctada imbricata]
MSDDETNFLKKKLSVESDCELDSLARIPSLNTSYSTLHSPGHREEMSNFYRSQRPGGSEPPHRGYMDEEAGSSRYERSDQYETPVRKLRPRGEDTETYELRSRKDDAQPPQAVRREYSDAYLESNLRTPRYNTHMSYDDMINNIATDDPFGGDYKPSGKTKKSKKKHKRDQEDSLSSTMHSRSSSQTRKSKKKKKEAESVDSTHTYTIRMDGHSNQSYAHHETESIKSNGTYTMGDRKEDLLDSGQPMKMKEVSPRRAVGVKSRRNKRGSSLMNKTSRNKINKKSFTAFVKEHRIMQRNPKEKDLIEGSQKEIWHYHTHTEARPCDSFGVIDFQGFGTETDDSPYIRISPDTDPAIIWRLLIEQFKLDPPQLLISVTGGAKRFEMKEKILDRLKRGLIDAAVSTDAWIITGGSKSGVMEFVGDAVRDHRITSGRTQDVVAIGIATWGMVANRHNLDGDDDNLDGNFPAIYSRKDIVDCIPFAPKDVPLDENYSHFILVDDGSEGKFGREIDFRNAFEKFVSTQHCDMDSKDSTLTVPVIMLIVEGGINSMKTVWGAVTTGTPVLVLASSGRAADFIAYGYKITANRHSEEKSTFPGNFQEEMEQLAESIFEWRPQDETKKPAMIANCIKQLKEALKHRTMLTVFNLKEIDRKEFDKALLYALLKANRSNTNAQLSLALAWNRSDIAKNEIFDKHKRTTFQELQLDDAMATALIQDRLEFVRLFLENGINLKSFLDIRNLWNIYSNCIEDESDSAAQLLVNRIMYLRQTWAAYLCCRPVEQMGNHPDLLNDIGKVITHLLGDGSLNPYSGKHYEVEEHLEPVFGYVEKKEEGPTMNYKLESKKGMRRSKSRGRQFDFERPEKELFLLCVLLNRMEMAKVFWRMGQDHVGAAIFACSLMKGMSSVADDEEEVELSIALSQNADEFEQLACNVLFYCYVRNRELAHQLLVRKMKAFGKQTCFMMADGNQLMEFMGQTACQTKLNEIWKGRMAMYTSTLKIVISIFFPFVIPSIKFTIKKTPSDIIEEADDAPEYDKMQLSEVVQPKDKHIHSPRVYPDPPQNAEEETLTSKTKIIKHKLYKVNCLGACSKQNDGINVISAFYYFYTAPVTVFWCNVLAYLVFLSFFSYFVLTDLYPLPNPHAPADIEMLTWGWTLTMVLEEIRQVLSKDQQSIMYKLRNWFGSVWNRFDLIMYTLFLTSVILRFALDESNFLWARIFYSVTLAMYFLRIMQYFYVEKNIGPKVIMISRMITDLLFFFMILVVFILSFGVMYQANLFPNSVPEWKILKQVVYLPYWQMYGELFWRTWRVGFILISYVLMLRDILIWPKQKIAEFTVTS